MVITVSSNFLLKLFQKLMKFMLIPELLITFSLFVIEWLKTSKCHLLLKEMPKEKELMIMKNLATKFKDNAMLLLPTFLI